MSNIATCKYCGRKRLHLFIRQNSYVYVFDGLPRFLNNGVVHSDRNLIGAFCGTTRMESITVEATSGEL